MITDFFYSSMISILIKHIVGLFVCLSVCLSEIANLLRLKMELHETRHVGPLDERIFEYYLSQRLKNRHASSLAHSLIGE